MNTKRLSFALLLAFAIWSAFGYMRFGLSVSADAAAASLNLAGLRVEYKENPVGIDAREPRFNWQIQSDRRGILQSAYQIEVARSEGDFTATKLVWDTGKISSDESIQRVYGGPSLQSRQRYYWRVRVWDAAGNASDWSKPAFFEMGLLQPADWFASLIEPDIQENPKKSEPVPMLRHEFKLNGSIERARAYITSHGLYEVHLNGQRVGDQVFAPGWTSYNKRLQYQTYDVTALLKNGDNAVGAMLGNGWYRGEIGFGGQRNYYGDRVALLLQIDVTYKDGRHEVIGTDKNWKATTGPILMSEIYHGETYDARLEKTGWDNPGFSDGQWSAVHVADHRKDDLIAPQVHLFAGFRKSNRSRFLRLPLATP